MGFRVEGIGFRVYGVHGDLITIYPKPYLIYLRGTITVWGLGLKPPVSFLFWAWPSAVVAQAVLEQSP